MNVPENYIPIIIQIAVAAGFAPNYPPFAALWVGRDACSMPQPHPPLLAQTAHAIVHKSLPCLPKYRVITRIAPPNRHCIQGVGLKHESLPLPPPPDDSRTRIPHPTFHRHKFAHDAPSTQNPTLANTPLVTNSVACVTYPANAC